ncbi:MAG: PilZ domain-containing protein [Magnetococcales bacterium]|nr:PilZ domain-containing protein [Magnetococcales bacterium]
MGSWSNTLWDQVLLGPALERRQESRTTSSDRRRSVRRGFFHPVTLVTADDRHIPGHTRNASANGLLMLPAEDPVDSLTGIRPGEKATLVFPDSGQTIEFTCRIVRITRHGIALVW